MSFAASNAALIDGSANELRADIAWLVDRRVLSLPLGTWPMPVFMLQTAIAEVDKRDLAASDQAALDRLRHALQWVESSGSIGLRVNSARHPSLDGQSAQRSRSEAFLAVQRGDERAFAKLKIAARDLPLHDTSSALTLDGSYVAMPWRDALIVLGAVDRWWGPGVFTSPLLSTAAAPIPSLLLRRREDTRAQPSIFRWLGPWGYDISVGRLQHYTPQGTRAIGMRLYSRPLPGLEVGASRFITWGGQGRPNSGSALFDALVGRSNIDDPITTPDPSNELAGFDLRLSAPVGDAAWAGYAHVVGEDEARHLPSRVIATLGTQLKHPLGESRIEWSIEGTDTELGRAFGLRRRSGFGPAYVHGAFIDGHYHQGLPIGANIGGGGLSLTAGVAWFAPPGGPIDRVSFSATGARVNERGAEPRNAAFPVPARIYGASLRVQSAGRAARWHVGLSIRHDTSEARRRVGVLAGIEMPLEKSE